MNGAGFDRGAEEVVVGPDRAVMVADDAMHDRQAEAGPPAFGREMGQEELALFLGWDTTTTVFDPDLEGAVALACGDGDAPAGFLSLRVVPR